MTKHLSSLKLIAPSQVRVTCYQSTMLNWYYLWHVGEENPNRKKPSPPSRGLVLQVGGCAEGQLPTHVKITQLQKPQQHFQTASWSRKSPLK